MNADYTPMSWSYVIGAVSFAATLLFAGWVTVTVHDKWQAFRRWQDERDDFSRWEHECAQRQETR